MTHPLDGVRLKIVRAQEHLKVLKEEVGRYLDSRPYELLTERENDRMMARLVIKTEPPLGLSCIVGDCVNNLRTSLDYIVWQLAVRHSSTPLIIGKDRLYFPFKDSATSFNTDSLAKYSIPAHALNLIESVQPYHTGYEFLRFLPILTNEDRHCLPLLTLAQIRSSAIRFHDDKGKTIFSIVGAVFGSKQITGHLSGAGIGLDTPKPGTPEQATSDVKVECQATIFVAFQNPTMPHEPIDRTLEQMVECVAHVVPRFDPYV